MLPSIDDLNAMCELIGGPGACFDALPIPERIKVIELVNQCDTVTLLSNIETTLDSLPTELNVGIAEAIASNGGIKKLAEHLDDIDTSLRTVAEWFDKSKVYYP